jgi:hypothetical protein
VDKDLSKNPIIEVMPRPDGTERVRFVPTSKMRAFAIALFAEPELRGKTPEDVLRYLGFSAKLWKDWQGFNPYFEEWLEAVEVQYSPKHIAREIEAVGLEKALAGDFQFWKPFALKHKIISPDNATLTVIPANLGNFSEWSEADVEKHRTNLMETIRGIQDQGRYDLVAETPGTGSEDHSRRVTSVPEEPLEVPSTLGSDRERPSEV